MIENKQQKYNRMSKEVRWEMKDFTFTYQQDKLPLTKQGQNMIKAIQSGILLFIPAKEHLTRNNTTPAKRS